MANPTRRGFGSDNHAPVHPQIMEALVQANQGHAPSYGTDPLSSQCAQAFRELFAAPKAEVFFVFNGTAANVCSMQTMVSSYQSVLVSEVCHMIHDECGAPEFLTGATLKKVPTVQGKITVSELTKALVRRGDQHSSQVRAVSITQPTEIGTCYTLEEIRAIAKFAKENQLLLHVDGARIANSVYATGHSFVEQFTNTGVDVVSFGGTKNGLMMGEAIVFLNPDLAKNFKYIRKQSLQLPSKTRYFAAQFLAYLTNDLWRKMAANTCDRAAELYEAVKDIPGVEVQYPRQSNAVFAKIPRHWVADLRGEYFFYVWDESTFVCRWMMSWDSQSEEIQSFAQHLRILSQQESLRAESTRSEV